MKEKDLLTQAQTNAQQYFNNMDEAINAICFALFPHNPTIEAIGEVNKSSFPTLTHLMQM